MHKIGQLGVFSGRPLGPLQKARLSLIRNVLKPLAKSFLTLICVCMCVREGGFYSPQPPCWFSLNNSETVKDVTLAFNSI